jgi:hypothetical protein
MTLKEILMTTTLTALNETPLMPAGIFEVHLRLLHDPRGTLVVESAQEIKRRYAEMRDDARIRFAAEEPKALDDQLARFDAAEAQEIDLFGKLEKGRAKDISGFTFKFRLATLTDHEAADAEATKTGTRQELVYRRVLAERTFIGTDLPAFTDFPSLRTDIALHVLRQVADRVTLAQDVRAFMLG